MTEDPTLQQDIIPGGIPKIELLYHLAWMITDATPELGEDGRVKVSPKQQEQVLNLAQDVWQLSSSCQDPNTETRWDSR